MSSVGLIGFGRATRSRLKALSALGIKSASVATLRSRELYQWLEQESLDIEVNHFNDSDDLLTRCDAPLVFICSESQRHAAQARAALEKDRHVCVEFPLTDSLDEGLRLFELSKSVDRLLHIECIGTITSRHVELKRQLSSLPSSLSLYHSRFTGSLYRWIEEAARAERWGLLTYGRLYKAVDVFGALSVSSAEVSYHINQGSVSDYHISITLQSASHRAKTSPLFDNDSYLIRIEERRGEGVKREQHLQIETAEGPLTLGTHQSLPLFLIDTRVVLKRAGIVDDIPDLLTSESTYSSQEKHQQTLALLESLKEKIKVDRRITSS